MTDLPLVVTYIALHQSQLNQKFIDLMKDNYIQIQIVSECPHPMINLPFVYISVGGQPEDFQWLMNLPLYQRKRWIHVNRVEEITPKAVYNIYLYATEPKMIDNSMIAVDNRGYGHDHDQPLISIYTAAYRSGNMIQRPFQSLLKQTYRNFEWIIVDDSGDDDLTFKQVLQPLAKQDPRIFIYRPTDRSGYIGTVKRMAAGLCRGKILVELDHDDAILPTCLQQLLSAFQSHPECGFAFGYCAELSEDQTECWYGDNFAFGFGTFYHQTVEGLIKPQITLNGCRLNQKTVQHLVGLPNHPRAWTRQCYHDVGGYRDGLLVADDYDLLVRTFLHSKFIEIPQLMYLQYRNNSGNQTFIRNRQIQTMCRQLYAYYSHKITNKLKALNAPTLPANHVQLWTSNLPQCWINLNVVDLNPNKTSHIVHSPTDLEIVELARNCSLSDELIVVGTVPTNVPQLAILYPAGLVKWSPTNYTPVQDLIFASIIATGSHLVIHQTPSTMFDQFMQTNSYRGDQRSVVLR
jgi:glycosyltransferase involved in cell wall biosynthesis